MVNKYYVQILWDEEDQIFVARVPELEGVATHGATREEAAKNADEAIALHLKVLNELKEPIPKPISEKEFSGNMSLRMGEERHKIAAILAAKDNKSLNEYILELIDQAERMQRPFTADKVVLEPARIANRASVDEDYEVQDIDVEEADEFIGSLRPESRVEIVQKLWAYTKKHNLHDRIPGKKRQEKRPVVSVGMLKKSKGRSMIATKAKKK